MMTLPEKACTISDFRKMHHLQDNVLNVLVETSRLDLNEIDDMQVFEGILIDPVIQVDIQNVHTYSYIEFYNFIPGNSRVLLYMLFWECS